MAQPVTPAAPGRTPAVFTPDAQYLAGAAQRQFARTTQINELQAASADARSTMQESIRRLMQDVPGQREQVSEQANRQGLFYSGQLGKRLGDLEAAVARQRADVQSTFDREERARAAARTAIQQGASFEEAAARAEAVERQLARDEQAAASNSLVKTPMPKAAKPKPRPKAKPKPKKRRPKPRGRRYGR